MDAWINDPPSESEDEAIMANITEFFPNKNSESYAPEYQKTKNYVEPTQEELDKQRETRKQSEQTNPFYLKDAKKTKPIEKVLNEIFFFS